MKKFISGLVVGLILATTVPAFAATLTATRASFNIKLNDKAIQLSTLPVVINGSTYLPLRATADLLGYDVGYVGATRTISLDSRKIVEEPVEPPVVTPVAVMELDYQAIKIDGKLYGYNYFDGSSRISPYLTDFYEAEINGTATLLVPCRIDIRSYAADIYGTQSGLFNLLQIIVGEYSTVPSNNPFLSGNIQLDNASGNWSTTNEDLTSSCLKLGYEVTYVSASEKSVDQWYEYEGKQFREPISAVSRGDIYSQDNITFVYRANSSDRLLLSINELLKYWGINKSISYGTDGSTSYVEIK